MVWALSNGSADVRHLASCKQQVHGLSTGLGAFCSFRTMYTFWAAFYTLRCLLILQFIYFTLLYSAMPSILRFNHHTLSSVIQKAGTCCTLPNLMMYSVLCNAFSACKLQGWPEPYIYGVHTVFLAGKSPYIRSYTVYIYGSGQPYKLLLSLFSMHDTRQSTPFANTHTHTRTHTHTHTHTHTRQEPETKPFAHVRNQK